ncbi:hypothetical protein CEUSTIGMA_g6897.t1 [Chlamydomonas eustigma]|uniref:Kinetochore protein SPC25 n=1 Tax=Chlamydomonas eustigma TaxID=1157962 RepID=A0A250X8R5_9CHLO|nr:hypothetical protein CEUSTIGMA_g6897.t1 [Chlamydomonas eustigma]|eukprot:GAX79456.1 hypothetical protein CEUSTIGMA_g6897.t1 [Chlamydomonas eustigma]
MLDLRELERELSSTKNTVDTWAKQAEDCGVSIRDAYHMHSNDQSVKVSTLQARQLELADTAKSVKERLEREEREAAEARQVISFRQEEELVQRHKLQALQEELSQKEQACLALESAADLDESIVQKKISALKRALSLYSSRLGLEFKQGPDELHLHFTQVDQSQPQRSFMVGVKVHDDKSYEVTKCSPPVRALGDLVQVLNQTNDFSEFVKAIRQEFVKSINVHGV